MIAPNIIDLASMRWQARIDENGKLISADVIVASSSSRWFTEIYDPNDHWQFVTIGQLFTTFLSMVATGELKFRIMPNTAQDLSDKGVCLCGDIQSFVLAGHCEYDIPILDALSQGKVEVL